MTQTTAVLHAGLLARKGEARPASISGLEALTPVDSGRPTIIDIDQAMRRQPVGERPEVSTQLSRVIELPRPKSARRKDCSVKNRKQIHTRVSLEINVSLKINATRLDRRQQDLVASAVEAYLSFVGDDVLAFRCDGRNVGD